MLFPFTSEAEISNPLTGNYYGTATISAPSTLGTIDLSFYLDVTGTNIQHDSSYINLDKTLLFPKVAPQVNGIDVGPRVTGTASPTSFNLTTDTFTNTVSGKTVTRQIVLHNTTVTNDGSSITGTFTETITGLSQDVVTVTGTFILVKPVVSEAASVRDLNADGCIDLDEIKAGGNNASAVEFSDISYAINLYNNPLPSLSIGTLSGSVCTGGEQTMKDAYNDYYNSKQ